MSWSDGPRGLLESKFGSIVHTLEERADADDRAAIDCAQRFAELRREQEARDEHARRELIEAARLERLLAEVTAWRRSEEIRAYVSALEERLPTLESDEEVRIGEWSDGPVTVGQPVLAHQEAPRTFSSRKTCPDGRL